MFSGEENEKLCSFFISPLMVWDKLKKLKINKAPGVDLISTTCRMLIELSEVVCDTVAEIYNKSIVMHRRYSGWMETG